jgi:hypothetical protein
MAMKGARVPSRPPAAESVLQEVTKGLLEPDERVVNNWTTVGQMPSVLLILTNRKVLGFRIKGVFTKTYEKVLARNLEDLPEPKTVEESGVWGLALLAGQKFRFSRADAETLCAEVSHSRTIRVQLLEGGKALPPVPGHAEKEVITREVVKIRCRFCGQLNDQGTPKCAQCGAPT